MKDNIFTKQLGVITAQVCIMILGVCALYNGVDGAIFALTIAAIAGLGGYQIRHNHTQVDKEDKRS